MTTLQQSTIYNQLSVAGMKSILSTHLANAYVIPESIQPELKEYKLVYWSAAFLYSQIHIDFEGKITGVYYIERSGILYTVTMQNCILPDLYKVAREEPDRQIRISFRQARDHWQLPAACIIKLPAKFKSNCKPLRYSNDLDSH